MLSVVCDRSSAYVVRRVASAIEESSFSCVLNYVVMSDKSIMAFVAVSSYCN